MPAPNAREAQKRARSQTPGSTTTRARQNDPPACIVDDNQICPLSLQATAAAGRIGFWRKVSSEEDCGIYRFSIDGNMQATLSGESDWGEVPFPVTAGKHTFTWEYRKDPSGAFGADTVYLDDVSIPVAP